MADPVVPDAPGVPPLVRSGPAPEQPELLTGDTINTVGVTSNPQWGLFKDGEPVVFSDNVVGIDFRQDWSLLDYPVEDGAFETYNKVKTPFEIQLRFSSGGSENNRAALLSDIAYLAETEDLYDVVTPEVSYSNCNIEHYDYKRTSDNGVGLIVVDVHLRQIRVAATPAFSQTAAPSGADPSNIGAVQTGPATSQQTTMVYNLFNEEQKPSLPGTMVSTFPTSQINLFPPNGAGF